MESLLLPFALGTSVDCLTSFSHAVPRFIPLCMLLGFTPFEATLEASPTPITYLSPVSTLHDASGPSSKKKHTSIVSRVRQTGAGEMAPMIKCLLDKHSKLSLDLQHSHPSGDGGAFLLSPVQCWR